MSKIPVAILGATGMVGQRFIERLSNHPYFEIIALAASSTNVGKKLIEIVHPQVALKIAPSILKMPIVPCLPNFPCRLVFSALDAQVAGEIEKDFLEAGYFVISNARNFRTDPLVPLLIPEINPDHLALLRLQSTKGKILTNPNCSTIGLSLAIKPLIDHFGIDALFVTTLQAISGAGYPGVSSVDILDNVIPYIEGEEEKMESEPLKIFGTLSNDRITPATLPISAQCNRVAVQDGHLECISIKLKNKATKEELIEAWNGFRGLPQTLELPSAPLQPLIYLEQPKSPQPKFHRDLGSGMSVAIGRLRKCPLLDYKFVILSHNTIRGAAGSTILIGELLAKEGYFN
jgi:aspartate-semialdehyde dehydrogenase